MLLKIVYIKYKYVTITFFIKRSNKKGVKGGKGGKRWK